LRWDTDTPQRTFSFIGPSREVCLSAAGATKKYTFLPVLRGLRCRHQRAKRRGLREKNAHFALPASTRKSTPPIKRSRITLRKELKERGLKQTEAADLLGIAQPDVSDLVREKLARFSMERLERFLNALDMDVTIQVGRKPEGKERAGISVELVGSF